MKICKLHGYAAGDCPKCKEMYQNDIRYELKELYSLHLKTYKAVQELKQLFKDYVSKTKTAKKA